MFYFNSDRRPEGMKIDDWRPDDLPPPSRLSNVAYRSDDAHRAPFLRWLSDHQPKIEHLTLLSLSRNEFEPAAALLRALGPHLRILDISYKDDAPSLLTQDPMCLPLLANINLHTLRISCMPLSFPSPSPNQYIFLTLLNSNSPVLRCITLEQLKPGEGMDSLEWNDLDVILACRAPALECLHVYVAGEPLYERFPSMRTALETQMPWCLQRGALRGMSIAIDRGKLMIPMHEQLPPILAPGLTLRATES
ncbi:hypothetical protein BD779DRAFT_65564 [Infundibulicybe gibba]|nr:hypothetical protein BD779DRAFT_65564 [Infundibulicybe gibba]